LTSKYTEIGGIRAAERHLLIFFFIPTPTGHPKGVQKWLARKKIEENILYLLNYSHPFELLTPVFKR
jgi:hypothetical protein